MDTKLTVLLADDDDVFRMLVRRVFQSDPEISARCELICVADGTDAVNYYYGREEYKDRDLHPRPDIMILDQRMTRMDGSEALHEIKSDEAARSMPVCMFSTSAHADWLKECYGYGAAFCSEKPLDTDLMARKIRIMLDFFIVVMGLPYR